MNLARIIQSTALAAAAIVTTLAPALAQAVQQTSLEIANRSNVDCTVWFTLNNYGGISNPGFVQSVVGLPWRHPVNMKQVPGNQFQGSFKLRAGDNAILTTPPGTGIAGNVAFNNPPNNCRGPNTPNGQNLGEFTLNNNTPTFFNNVPPFTQEAVDISCVNGVDVKMAMELVKQGNSGNWSAGAGYPNVTSFANVKFSPPPTSNTGIPGVFPIGCDNCTSSNNPGCSPQWSGYSGNSAPICNVQRPGGNSGGTVRIIYNGEFKVAAQSTRSR